jgi:hypothetical protein
MLRWFPISSCCIMLLVQSCQLKFIKISPLLWRLLNYLSYQMIISTCINEKIKIALCLSQASTSFNLNVCTLILALSEGQVGRACEPCNKTILFLHLEIKSLSLLPHNFSLFSYASTSLPISIFSELRASKSWKIPMSIDT